MFNKFGNAYFPMFNKGTRQSYHMHSCTYVLVFPELTHVSALLWPSFLKVTHCIWESLSDLFYRRDTKPWPTFCTAASFTICWQQGRVQSSVRQRILSVTSSFNHCLSRGQFFILGEIARKAVFNSGILNYTRLLKLQCVANWDIRVRYLLVDQQLRCLYILHPYFL